MLPNKKAIVKEMLQRAPPLKKEGTPCDFVHVSAIAVEKWWKCFSESKKPVGYDS